MRNFYLAWDFSGRLQADGWIPCSRWQHSHSIHELVDSGQEMMAVAGAVSQRLEHLIRHQSGHHTTSFPVTYQIALLVNRSDQ